MRKPLDYYRDRGTTAARLTRLDEMTDADNLTRTVGEFVAQEDDADRLAAEQAHDDGYCTECNRIYATRAASAVPGHASCLAAENRWQAQQRAAAETGSRRIIDCDIDAYTGFEEAHEMALRRCLPSDEPLHLSLRIAAADVLRALIAYRTVIDA